MKKFAFILSVFAAAAAGAQTTVASIDPGMTREQVVAKLGEPLSARSLNGITYLFYKNGCEKTCGMNDLVTLDSGKVIDAVFRSPSRKYTGMSSSPRMISMAEAAKGSDAPKATKPLVKPAGAPKKMPPTTPKKP
jgi:hypothetical protein